MTQLIKKAAIFLLAIFLAACAIEAYIFIRMKDKRAHVHEDWPDMHGLDADVIFLGNSRTAGHVIPKTVGQGLKAKFYNLGYDGYTSQMGAYRLEYLLEYAATKPKIVAVQFDTSFCTENGFQENFSMKDGVLRYFFLDQIGINRFYRNYNNWRELDAYLPLLRYKGYPLIFFKHLLGWNRWDRRSENGFWHTDKSVGFQLDAPPNNRDNLTASLSGIDSICIANGITLIAITPPSPSSSYRPSDAQIQSLSHRFNVWDYSDLFAESESSYFYDNAHFSQEGAQEYSHQLNNRFKELFATSDISSSPIE